MRADLVQRERSDLPVLRGYGIAPALQSDSLAEHCSPALASVQGSTFAVTAGKVGTEYKYRVRHGDSFSVVVPPHRGSGRAVK